MRKKVYISESIYARAVEMLREHFDVIEGHDINNIAEEAQGCSGILVRVAKITGEIMDAIPTLEVVAKHGVGVDNIDVAAATQRGILVVNAPHANSNAVAEHTLALILASCKKLVYLDKKTRDGNFAERNNHVLTELRGKTVGLVGLGRIARLLAEKLGVFGVRIIGSDPFVSDEVAAGCGIERVDIERVFAEADIISLHTPLNKDTEKMVNEKLIDKMKPSAIIVNASRGPIVDEMALFRALRAGRIAGAALDVFDPEPPVCDNPLFSLDNVIVSPHNAALTDVALEAMAMDSATGIADYLMGRKPAFPVNKIM